MKFKKYLIEVTIDQIKKLPDFIPLPLIQKVQKKYNLNPIWKEWTPKSRTTHSHTLARKYCVINPKHKNDLRTQLHELGHYILDQGYVDIQGVKRLFEFYKKTLKLWGEEKNVKNYGFKVIDGQAINMKNKDEFFAEMFQLYTQNLLKGDNKKVMQMLMTGKRF